MFALQVLSQHFNYGVQLLRAYAIGLSQGGNTGATPKPALSRFKTSQHTVWWGLFLRVENCGALT